MAYRRTSCISLDSAMSSAERPLSERTGSVAVVAHDAGGAAVLASYVKQEGIVACFVLAGPAKQIFKDRCGEIHCVSLSEALISSSWVLTGTGWQTDFEWQAIRQGRAAGKHVVTFLDHWVNYPARFVRKAMTCYPDEIWVGDAHAAEIARKSLPEGLIIRQIENPYFRAFTSEMGLLAGIRKIEHRREKSILFVSENINRDSFNQNDVIRYFMGNLNSIGVKVGEILIRPHPSELAEKYAWAEVEFGKLVKLSRGARLEEEVAASDIVVGCSSMAMALAAKAGKRVISCIPDYKMPLTLPFEQIEILSIIIDKSKE